MSVWKTRSTPGIPSTDPRVRRANGAIRILEGGEVFEINPRLDLVLPDIATRSVVMQVWRRELYEDFLTDGAMAEVVLTNTSLTFVPPGDEAPKPLVTVGTVGGTGGWDWGFSGHVLKLKEAVVEPAHDYGTSVMYVHDGALTIHCGLGTLTFNGDSFKVNSQDVLLFALKAASLRA